VTDDKKKGVPRFAQDVMRVLGGQVAMTGMGVLTGIITARWLGPTDRGLFNHRLAIRQAHRPAIADDLDLARVRRAGELQDLRQRSCVSEADKAIKGVRNDELPGRGCRRGLRSRRGIGECETSSARPRRPRRFEREVVALFRRQHGVAGRVTLEHRQMHRFQHDAAADARLGGYRPFHEHAVTQPWRRDRRADVGLQRQEIQLAVVLGEPAWN